MARGKSRGRYSPRRRGGGNDGGGDAWLTTYADAVTLLMAFFVMLYAMSEIDVDKFAAFLEGLQVPFGNEVGDGLLPERTGLAPENDPVPPVGEPDETDADHERGPESTGRPDQDASADDALDAIAAALHESLRADDLERFVEQRREERGLVVSIASDDVLFALGSTRIDTRGRRVIRAVSETLDDFPNPLLVEGHTDNVPLERPGYTNWNLSTDRAVAVLSLMIEEHRLSPVRVGAVGYGEHRPLADNDTAAGRAVNRRVDIVVLTGERTT